MTTIATRSAAAMPLAEPDPQQLKRELRAAQTRKRLGALALIAPLAIFLLLTFVAPIVALLQRAIENPEVAATLPQTVAVLSKWDRKSALPDQAFSALAEDLARAKEDTTAGNLARRLNIELSGSRSLVMGTARAMPLRDADGKALSPAAAREAIIALNAQWGQPDVWRVIAQNGSVYSPYYLLASLDLRQNVFGDIEAAAPESAIYRTIFGRTLWMSAVVTLITLLLAYPLAYWLSTMQERRANLLMILVLIPFWTSILVRVAAWIVLLQSEGLVNKALMLAGLTQSPLELVFNRVGVYISMTHILLPFMILPLYTNLEKHDPALLEAAQDLGAGAWTRFWRITFPLSLPGIWSGTALVFIPVLGMFAIPELLGGTGDLLIGNLIKEQFLDNRDWPLGSTLALLLTLAVLALAALAAWAGRTRRRSA